MFESINLFQWMMPQERIVLDRGYLGLVDEPNRAIIGFKEPRTQAQRAWNRLIKSVRIDVERVIAYFKRFSFLKYTRTKSGLNHNLVFHFLAHLINIRLELVPFRDGIHPNVFNARRHMPE